MAEPIEGKVAKILNDQTMILNIGRAAGVAQGMIFCIFAPVEDVTDPETGESLGSWEAVKGYVQATHPQERLTVCSGGPLAKARLNVDASQVAGMPEVGPITLGDSARSVDEADLPA